MLKIKDILVALLNITVNTVLMFMPCWVMLNNGCYSIVGFKPNLVYLSVFILGMQLMSVLSSGIQIIAWLVFKPQGNQAFLLSGIWSGLRFLTNFLQCLLVLIVIEISGSKHDYRFPMIVNIIWSCLIVVEFLGTFIIFLHQRHNFRYLNV